MPIGFQACVEVVPPPQAAIDVVQQIRDDVLDAGDGHRTVHILLAVIACGHETTEACALRIEQNRMGGARGS